MDPDIDVCQTEQPQISYSVDFTAEQSSAMGSPILLDREGTHVRVHEIEEVGAPTGTCIRICIFGITCPCCIILASAQ